MKQTLVTVDSASLARALNISKQNAANRLSVLRRKTGKPKHSLITLDEFCAYHGFKRQDVEKYFI